jgi:thiol-disulfide isomerase/thioredoxin
MRTPLHTILALACLCVLSACDANNASAPPPPPASRFEAVTAKAASPVDPLMEFCDVRAEPGLGKELHLPALEGAPTPNANASALHWVNVWATWCKPCVEELPMLPAWQQKLAAAGKSVSLQFVSVDDSAETVTTFRTQHPNAPPSQRITDPGTLAAFIADLGLDAGAGLPLHIFVDPGAHVRCVRSGAVTEAHYSVIASMLK